MKMILLYWCHLMIIFISVNAGSVPSSTDSATMRYFYTDDSMQQSIAYKLLHQHEQQELQEEILHVMGLDHKPKPKRYGTDESASKYLMDLYTSLNDQRSNDMNKDFGTESFNSSSDPFIIDLKQSDIIMSFLNQIKTQRGNKHLRHNRDRRYWFNVTNIPKDSEIMDAELRIYRDMRRSRYNSSYDLQLTLFQLFYGFNRDEVIMNFVDSLKIDGNVHGWIRFNVTQPVIDWIKLPYENLGLYLQIRTSSIPKDLSSKSIGLMNARGVKKYQPFMTAYIKSDRNNLQAPTYRLKTIKNSRQRREVMNKKQSDASYYDPDDNNPFLKSNDRISSRTCKKHTLFVAFRDLNWQNWIIAPEGYAAFYCKGDCSFPMNHMNATNHAIVQQLVYIMNRYVPKPCCAPSELSSIMVLYFDDNSNVVLKKFKNMVVQSCGCH